MVPPVSKACLASQPGKDHPSSIAAAGAQLSLFIREGVLPLCNVNLHVILHGVLKQDNSFLEGDSGCFLWVKWPYPPYPQSRIVKLLTVFIKL